MSYSPSNTAVLPVHPYNDFLSEDRWEGSGAVLCRVSLAHSTPSPEQRGSKRTAVVPSEPSLAAY
jgi:hypothetical protein